LRAASKHFYIVERSNGIVAGWRRRRAGPAESDKAAGLKLRPQGRRRSAFKPNNKAEWLEKKEETMAEKEIQITPKTYIFALVGAILAGVMGGAALGGDVAMVSSAIVGALAGGALGLYF
jgi:hypothetical protein